MGGRGARPPKLGKKIFFGQLCKIRAIFGQKSSKIGNFVIWSNIKKSGIVLIFGHESCKIRAFC